MNTRPPADDREREEEREDRQAEARHGEQGPAVAGHAQGDRKAERGEQPVRRAEAPPGDHGEHDEEHEEREILQVDGGGADRVGVLDRGPVDVRVRARCELLDPRPARPQAVPDPAERSCRREVPAPEPLRPHEGPGVTIGLPEVERVRAEQERGDRQRAECAQAVAFPPREQRERRQQRDAGRSRQQGEPGREARGQEPPPLSESERGQRQQQVERLAVDRLQEEREREERKVEHRAPCPVGPEALLGDPVQKQERAERRGERDQDSGEDVVPEERAPEDRHGRRVQRVEGRSRTGSGAVAVLRDPQEPDAVPPCPHVGDGAEVVGQRRVVPACRTRVPVRHEDEEREQGCGPDRGACPEKDLRRRVPRAREPQLAASRPRLAYALTGGHGAR